MVLAWASTEYAALHNDTDVACPFVKLLVSTDVHFSERR